MVWIISKIKGTGRVGDGGRMTLGEGVVKKTQKEGSGYTSHVLTPLIFLSKFLFLVIPKPTLSFHGGSRCGLAEAVTIFSFCPILSYIGKSIALFLFLSISISSKLYTGWGKWNGKVYSLSQSFPHKRCIFATEPSQPQANARTCQEMRNQSGQPRADTGPKRGTKTRKQAAIW